ATECETPAPFDAEAGVVAAVAAEDAVARRLAREQAALDAAVEAAGAGLHQRVGIARPAPGVQLRHRHALAAALARDAEAFQRHRLAEGEAGHQVAAAVLAPHQPAGESGRPAPPQRLLPRHRTGRLLAVAEARRERAPAHVEGVERQRRGARVARA